MASPELPSQSGHTRLLARAAALGTAAAEWAYRHQRPLMTTVGVVLGGVGVTTYAIAPLATDAAGSSPHWVVEVIPHSVSDYEIDMLASHEDTFTHADATLATDDVDTLLSRLGVDDPAAAAWLKSDLTSRMLWQGQAGKPVVAMVTRGGRLVSLVARMEPELPQARLTRFARLTVRRGPLGWESVRELVPLERNVRLAAGTVQDGDLFDATDANGVPDMVAGQLVDMFATEIDFHREVRRGDTFNLSYETLLADGEPAPWLQGAGRLLSAQIVTGGASHQALWFGGDEGDDGHAGPGLYFDFAGHAKQPSFLANPVTYSRITSGFAMRSHPITGQWKEHKGVDYAAPTGTPVMAVGEGVIAFAGVQGGYGNVVQVQHDRGRLTVYAHLSAIHVRQGQHVAQGQQVGAVGTTGRSTGPHLHFEFRIDGVHQDPLQMASSLRAVTVSPDQNHNPQFTGSVAQVRQQFAAAHGLVGEVGRID